jgi:hypothetical protein
MFRRAIVAIVLSVLLAGVATSGARAQQPMSSGQQAPNPSGWSFNVAPYLWVADINAATQLNLPPALGGTVSADSSVGFGELVSHLNFAVMAAADARYDRFSILTDFMYLNLGGAGSQFRSVNFPGQRPIPISTSVQAHVGLNMNAKIWTQTGGYTLLQGDWGNFDVIAGFRYLGMPVAINYRLTLALKGPRGNGATFGGSNSVSGTANLWNGIGGLRGRVRLADTGLFIPYYFDAGAGDSQFTWQISSGLGYHLSWGDVSLTYRYLSFEQKSDAVVQNMSVRGPLLMATFTF